MPKDTTIIIKPDDIPVRKRQPPPGKAIRDDKAYSRKRKHKHRADDADREKAPGGENPPGASFFRTYGLKRPRSASVR